MATFYLFFIVMFSFFTGCEEDNPQNCLKIGVTAGPHAEVMNYVKDIAHNQGLEVKIIEFNDFIMPNRSLNEGDININAYQHEPYLQQQIKDHGYDLVSVGKNLLMPIGLYSKRYTSIAKIPNKAHLVIPNDPTNGARALLLLEHHGFIQLKKHKGLPTLRDIEKNIKELKITEVEAPSIPRVLTDVDAAIVNTDWILVAGLDPKTALAIEDVN